jgi:hypothetical protein
MNTSINTLINKNLRVSSIYRRFGNMYFESWAWETFLWEGERIKEEYRPLDSANEVIVLHARIYEEQNK